MRERTGHLRDWLLITLSVASGSVDAICWLKLGKVFAAFMTGNVAFLGFRLGGAPEPPTVRVLAAIGGFAVGALIGSAIARGSSLKGVWPRRVTLVLAVSIGVQAVFLAFWIAVDGAPASISADFLIGIAALAMGMQTVAAFALGVRASFTTAATATLAVVMSDLSNWALSRRDRLRLFGVVSGILVGALLGALLIEQARIVAPVLPLVTVALVVLAAELGFGADGDRELPEEEERRMGVPARAHG